MSHLEIVEAGDTLLSAFLYEKFYLCGTVVFLNDRDIESFLEFIPNLSAHSVAACDLDLVFSVVFTRRRSQKIPTEFANIQDLIRTRQVSSLPKASCRELSSEDETASTSC